MHVRHLGPCLALWKYKIDTQVEMLGAGRTPQAGLSPWPPAGPSGAFCAPSQPSVPAPATARGAAREPRATELSGRQGRDPIGWVGLTEAEGKGPAPLPLRLLRGHNLRVSQLFYWLPLPPGAAPWGLWHFPTQYFPGPRGSGLEVYLVRNTSRNSDTFPPLLRAADTETADVREEATAKTCDANAAQSLSPHQSLPLWGEERGGWVGVGGLHPGCCSAGAGGRTVIAQPSPGLRVKGWDQRGGSSRRPQQQDPGRPLSGHPARV